MQLSRLSLSLFLFCSPRRCHVGAPGNVVNELSRVWSSRSEHRRIREDDFIRAPALAVAFLEFPWQVAARIIMIMRMTMAKMIPITVSPFYYFIVSDASLVALFCGISWLIRWILSLCDAGFIIVIGSGSGSRLDEIVCRWRKRRKED